MFERERRNPPEPLITTQLPELPWQRVGSDIFQWKGQQYLLVVDYFSRFIEIALLTNTTSRQVIHHMTSFFSRHGIPEKVVSDNGPPYTSEEFKTFAEEYGFVHRPSSPHYPQSNGEAERAVQTVKALLKNTRDPYLAMLTYRSTPISNGYCPSELFMARKLRTTVPTTFECRQPVVPDYEEVRQKEKEKKQREKGYYDQRHAVRPLPDREQGDVVWIPDRKESGTVVGAASPRSYLVSTPKGTYRRNRRHLREERQTEDVSRRQLNEEKAVQEETSKNEEGSRRQLSEEKQVQEETPKKEEASKTMQMRQKAMQTQVNRAPVTTRSGRAVRPKIKLDL